MFAYLTRIVWLLAQPMSVIMLLGLAGLVLLALKRRRPAFAALALSTVLLVLFAYTTLGYVIITPLENRFTRPAEPAHIDGIVVLGGGMDGEVNTVRGGFELARSGDRMVETLRLALAHPEARIVIAAGAAALAADQEPEALAAQRLFVAFGIDPARIVLDDKSRNTEENAAFAKDLAGPQAGQTWLLITSAFHMPRAVALFRRSDFAVIAWPADYLASGTEGFRLKLDQAPETMAVTTIALREWLGLAGYRLTGRIDEWLPGPEAGTRAPN